MEDTIKTKIQKLLNLSHENANTNEREQAMEMALALLAKHNLSIRDIHGIGKATEQFLDIKAEKWITYLVQAAAKLYYCDMLISKRYIHGSLVTGHILIGSTENILVCNDVLVWLIQSIKNESKKLYKGKSKLQTSFRLGAASMIYNRSITLTAKPIQQSTGINQLQVIRTELEAANNDYMKQKYNHAKKSHSRSSRVDGQAYNSGKTYGDTVNLGKQLANKQTLYIGTK